MKANDLASKLADDAENVAEWLFPNGAKVKREWCVGSVDGEAGQSLKVVISGSKTGCWKDFATDEAGDLIGLVMKAKRLNIQDACSEAMKFLGIEEKKVENEKKVYAKPTKDGVKPLHDLPLHWLRNTRKITEAALKAYRVATKGNAVMFPYLRDGELIAAKYRSWTEKKFWTDADCEPCLFGWQAIAPDARWVVLCEGELDALTLWDYGYPALSLPYGGGKGDKQQWISHEFDRLAVYDTIFLCLDHDKAGDEARDEIVQRLGRERCRVVKLPKKDANDCVQADVSPDVIGDAFINARSMDPESLKNAADYADQVWAEFNSREHGDAGVKMPWASNKQLLVLRPGEVSVWAGITGHGKSQVVGNIAVSAMLERQRVCIASLEFRPPKMLRRLQCQTIGQRNLDRNQSMSVSDFWRERLWVFDVTGTAKADAILETFEYAAKRYGIHLFVLDNLSKCGFSDDDYAGTKSFVDRLADFTKRLNVHLILVHHVRKTDAGEERPPRKSDVKGSGGIIDMSDTAVIVWRNKPKEREIRENKGVMSDMARMKPDCIVECIKQREGDSEPTYLLWFDGPSYQYLAAPDHRPARYMPGVREYSDEEAFA